jgi:hypothetical protein
MAEGLFVSTDGSGNISTIKRHTDWDRDWDLIIPGRYTVPGGFTDLLRCWALRKAPWTLLRCMGSVAVVLCF